jgi:Zn-dependent M28 family amino/carboxypeptidase
VNSKLAKTLSILTLLFLSFLDLQAQGISRDKLIEDIKYLSSDELEGRKTNTEGSLKARKYILDRFNELGLTSQYTNHTQYFSFYNQRDSVKYENAANIVGFVPGEESDKIIVITAHYDHLGKIGGTIYNGADDNASGTAALLAFAEYFSKNRPRYSMMFAALDAEEMGHRGATALLDDFPFPLENIVMNINMDMISRNEHNELYASGPGHYPELLPILDGVKTGAKVNLKYGHDDAALGKDDWTYSSDHAQFHLRKIPYVYFGVEDHKDYHQPSDTFENIDPEFYYNAAEFILRAIKAFDEKM